MSQPSYLITPENLSILNNTGEKLVTLELAFAVGKKQWRVERLEENPNGWTGHTSDPAVTVQITKTAQHLCVELHAPFEGAQDVVYFQGSKIVASHSHAFIPDDNHGAFPVAVDKAFTLTTQADMKHYLDTKEDLWMIAPPPHVIGLGDAQGAGMSFSIPECMPVDGTQFKITQEQLTLTFHHYSPVCDQGRFPRVFIDLDVLSSQDALARHLAHARDLGLVTEPKSQPDWWHNPLYCTWGDQCRLASGFDIATNQSLTRERILGWADKIRSFYDGEVNFIIDDGYFVGFGDFRLKPDLYPTLESFRELIAELKKRKFRVILWYTPFWLHADVPTVKEHPEWLLHRPDGSLEASPIWKERYRYDWTHPAVPDHHRNILRFLLVELGADGIKVDMTYANPPAAAVVQYDPTWGSGNSILRRTLEIIHNEVAQIKPEAFMTVNGIECYLQPFASAVRLNDLFNMTDATAWYKRAELVNRLMPDVAIDVDGWPAGVEKLREYPFVASAYGAPVSYYLDGTEIGPVTFGDTEINRMASVWNTYAHAPVRQSDRVNIDVEKNIFERRDAKGALKAISLNRTVFIAYGESAIRVTSNIDQVVTVPLEGHRVPAKAVSVARDGTRTEVALRVDEASKSAILTVQDAASGILYYELTPAL